MQTPNSLGRLDTGFPCGVFYWHFAVIPTTVKRSSKISLPNGTGRIMAGNLGALSFNRITTHHFPYRHVPPLEMTQQRAACSHSERKRMTPVLPSPLSFRPQRSEVEKSHCSMVQAALWQEISRLRASIELEVFGFISTCSPARNDMKAGSLYSLGGDENCVQNDGPRRKASRRLKSEV